MRQLDEREVPTTNPSRSDRSLAIFSKLPRRGKVFTRLQPTYSERFSLGLHTACLRDTLEMSQPLGIEGVARCLYLSAPWKERLIHSLEQDGLELRVQRGETLGRRLRRAFEEQLKIGYRRVVAIGTDTPLLDRPLIHRAFSLLVENPLVLGPAEDGGYYLVGLRRMKAPLFERIDWGSTSVLNATIERARELGLTPALLPPRFDVDTPEDVARLAAVLEELPGQAPRVARFLMHERVETRGASDTAFSSLTGESGDE